MSKHDYWLNVKSMTIGKMLKAWLLNVISVRRQKGENLVMRNKIC